MTKSEIAQAFSGGKFLEWFKYLTDITVWNTPGEQYLTWRKEIETFCKNISPYFSSLTTNFKQLNLIENDRSVTINGTAEFICEDKRSSFVSSWYVYEFDANKK